MIYICIPTTKERRARLKQLLASIDEHTQNIQHTVVIYENADGGCVAAIHNMLEGINGYVAILSDDVVVEKDWLKNLWDAFIDAFPDGSGAAQPYDNIQEGRLCQHPLAHSETIKKYLHKGYVHCFSDNEMTERLMRDCKYLYVPTARIEHRHFIRKLAPFDETYKLAFNEETIEKDRQLFITRANNGFKD